MCKAVASTIGCCSCHWSSRKVGGIATSVARTAWEACALSWLRPSTRRTELFIVLYFPFCVRCPSNAFEPADDRLSNLVGTVLLHEVETPDDDAVLVREAARQ